MHKKSLFPKLLTVTIYVSSLWLIFFNTSKWINMLFKNSKGIFWIKSIRLVLEGTKITISSFYHHAFTLSEQWFDLQHTPDRWSATGFSKLPSQNTTLKWEEISSDKIASQPRRLHLEIQMPGIYKQKLSFSSQLHFKWTQDSLSKYTGLRVSVCLLNSFSFTPPPYSKAAVGKAKTFLL